MGKLDGKYAVVTGAAKGIGKAIAAKFLEEGAAGIAILDYIYELAEKTARELDPEGAKTLPLRCDVADAAQTEAAAKQALEKFGRVDILVNNAGVIQDSMFHKMEDSQWFDVIDINLHGPRNMAKFILPFMRKQNAGSIVNIASISAFGLVAGQSNYSASKAGLIGFTKALAKESAPKGIRVNSISPGYIDTDILKAIPPNLLEESTKQLPMGRMGTPAEVANVAAFLACDESSYLSGQNIIVSGAATT